MTMIELMSYWYGRKIYNQIQQLLSTQNFNRKFPRNLIVTLLLLLRTTDYKNILTFFKYNNIVHNHGRSFIYDKGKKCHIMIQ